MARGDLLLKIYAADARYADGERIAGRTDFIDG
jgi:hypothetical protein